MTKQQKITLSASRDIPFNKLMLSQSNVRHVKAGVSIEELAEDIARRTLLASITVRPVLDDTRELQCTAPNLVALRTKDGVASLSDLVRSALRLRPDRIPIGEVRGAEALDLLKAWGTGHPGGIGTIHAGSALGALRRMEQLIQEAVVTVPRALIAETIDLIAVLSGRGAHRRLVELARVDGCGPDGDYRISPVAPPLAPAIVTGDTP